MTQTDAHPIGMPTDAVGPAAKPDPVVNFLFCIGHVFGLLLLVIPIIGGPILFISLRRHKAYLKSFPNNSYQ
jgi:hypothetical protein